MFDFIKKLFAPKQIAPASGFNAKDHPLGVTKNDADIDVRNIPFALVHAARPLSDDIKTDLTPFPQWYQLMLGTCVAHAFMFTKMVLDYFETGKLFRYSRRFFYVLNRIEMNQPNTDAIANQGLQVRPAVVALTTVGAIEETSDDDSTLSHSKYVNNYKLTNDMRKRANIARTGGHAYPDLSVEGLKQAVSVVRVVPITVFIDYNRIDSDGTLHAPRHIDGSHEIVVYGWDSKKRYFLCRNWWEGYETLYLPFDEVEQIVEDAVAFTDIPNDLIARAKQTQYIFLTTLKYGSKGEAVIQLQKRLIQYGLLDIDAPTTNFGILTLDALTKYQKLKGLATDGIFGPGSREMMNNDAGVAGVTKSKIDLWCEAIKKIENAKPVLNNPGNIKCSSIMHKDAISQDYRGICMFPTYDKGYLALRNMLVRACSGGSSVYRPDMTLLDFYHVYAPSSDGNEPKRYATSVAQYLGVTITTRIKELL